MICFADGHSAARSKKTNFFNALSAARFACETFTVLRNPVCADQMVKGGPDGQA